jgi:hypothetical protein
MNNLNPQFSKAHLTNLNLNNIKMFEAMKLEIIASISPECHYIRTKISWNLPSALEVITGGHTDRHTQRQTNTLET